MSLYLDVPFREKDEAKALGAKWDPKKKKWYVQNKLDYYKFQKWILSSNEDECTVLCDYFYIVEGTHTCFKCKKTTQVIGFGVENYYNFYQKGIYEGNPEPEYNFGEIHIASSIGNLPSNLLQYLKSNYNYFYGYSKFAETSYLGNHCQHCGVLQGNFYIFEEMDSPFFIDSEETARALKLFKVKLPFDIKTPCNIGLCSEDYLIKKYAEIFDFGGEVNKT